MKLFSTNRNIGEIFGIKDILNKERDAGNVIKEDDKSSSDASYFLHSDRDVSHNGRVIEEQEDRFYSP